MATVAKRSPQQARMFWHCYVNQSQYHRIHFSSLIGAMLRLFFLAEVLNKGPTIWIKNASLIMTLVKS